MEIQINNLSIKYKNKIILNDFSDHISSGEHIALMGASGIGKTSFINAVMKLINYD